MFPTKKGFRFCQFYLSINCPKITVFTLKRRRQNFRKSCGLPAWCATLHLRELLYTNAATHRKTNSMVHNAVIQNKKGTTSLFVGHKQAAKKGFKKWCIIPPKKESVDTNLVLLFSFELTRLAPPDGSNGCLLFLHHISILLVSRLWRRLHCDDLANPTTKSWRHFHWEYIKGWCDGCLYEHIVVKVK